MKFKQLLEFSRFASDIKLFFDDALKKHSKQDILSWSKKRSKNLELDNLRKKYDINMLDIKNHIHTQEKVFV